MRPVSVLWAFLLFGCAAIGPGANSADQRIDGSSDASFDKTYAQVVRPLSPAERRQFALALFGVLLPEQCLSPEAIVGLTFLPVSIDRAADLRTCRVQLNGKSYRDIIDAAKAKDSDSSASQALPTLADGSIPDTCLTIYGAAQSAIANKRDQVPEAKLRAALPPRSSIEKAPTAEVAELARSLIEIVDDVYGDLDVEPLTYATYKAEVCVRRLAHRVVPPDFRAVQPVLAACAQKPRDQATECAMTVAGSKESDGGS